MHAVQHVVVESRGEVQYHEHASTCLGPPSPLQATVGSSNGAGLPSRSVAALELVAQPKWYELHVYMQVKDSIALNNV